MRNRLERPEAVDLSGQLFGERAYELAIAAAYGQRLWDQLLAVGAPFSIMPYGTEAMGALRIEKGTPPVRNWTAVRPPPTLGWVGS